MKPLAIALFLFLAASPLAAQDTGIAVYYSDYFQGKTVANGEIYDADGMTAAHNAYPFGSVIKVTNLANDKSVELRVNDRMRSNSKVLVDVTRSAAEKLGFVREGRTQVRVELVSRGSGKTRAPQSAAPAGAKPSPARSN